VFVADLLAYGILDWGKKEEAMREGFEFYGTMSECRRERSWFNFVRNIKWEFRASVVEK